MTTALTNPALVPGFIGSIRELAAKHRKDPEQVYQWWREYSQTCRDFDQSPVMSEFERWYRKKLEAQS